MPRKTELCLIIAIIALAAFFRLWQLDIIPPGLYPDEAINGNDAVQSLESGLPGGFKVFYSENNGREGLFINLQTVAIKAFGKSAWSLRFVSAIAGILTVWALYLLAKELYNREIALISSFLLAISFWHVNFSRIGFRAILAPLFLTFAFYFFWRGIKTSHLIHSALSGIFWGLGLYTYISFRIAPLILILVLLAYWQTIRRDFSHDKYLHLRNNLIRGFALLMIAGIFISLPLGVYYLSHPEDFFGRTAQISIFSDPAPITSFIKNFFRSLAMFNFAGDYNWRHNFSGLPMLFWPVGALFAVGFIKTCFNLFKYIRKGPRKHGHFSTTSVLVLSWFFIMLLPVVFSNEGVPHALRSIIAVPAVFIMAGKGTWWLFEYLKQKYELYDKHPHEAGAVVGIVLAIFLSSVGFAEYSKYFKKWASNPNVAKEFNQGFVDAGKELLKMPLNLKKYVIVPNSDVFVNEIPMPAQTVMFITDTATPEKQKAKNIFYVTEKQYQAGEYDKGGIVIPLKK